MIEKEATAAGFRELTRWAATAGDADVPPEVLARAASVLGDTLAVIVAAGAEPEVERFRAKVLEEQRLPEATIFAGGSPRTDRFTAAVANAIAANWLELDEGYRVASCHCGVQIVPTLLSEAEAADIPVGRMLHAIALSYEIVTRIVRTWTPMNAAQHSHARYCAIAAAATAGLLQGRDGKQMGELLSAAATLVNAGPRSHIVAGALVRNVWPALGAWAGMMSAVWADCGIAGIDDSAYDVFTDVLGGTPRPDTLTEGLGKNWAILDGYVKIFACCQHTHSTVEAAMVLRQRLDGAALDDIAEVSVETHPQAMPLSNRQPATTLAGRFSVPHVLAVTLATGDAGAEAFVTGMLTDHGIARLREKVTLRPYAPLPPAPNDRPSRITLIMRDGRVLTEECLSARGGPDRPFPPDVLDRKMVPILEPVYPKFLPVFARMRDLDPAVLARGWAATVGAFTE